MRAVFFGGSLAILSFFTFVIYFAPLLLLTVLAGSLLVAAAFAISDLMYESWKSKSEKEKTEKIR